MSLRRPREEDDDARGDHAIPFASTSSCCSAPSPSKPTAPPRTEAERTSPSTSSPLQSNNPSTLSSSAGEERINKWNGMAYSTAYFEMLRTRRSLPVYEHKKDILETVRQHPVTLLVGETGSGKTTQVPQFLAELLSVPDRPFRAPKSTEPTDARALPLHRVHAPGAASGSPAHQRTTTPPTTPATASARPVSSCTTDTPASVTPASSSLCLTGMVACTQPRRIAAISVATRVAAEMDVTLGEQVGYHVRFQSLRSPHSTRVLYLTDGMLLREAVHDPLLSAYSVVIVDEAHERTVDTDLILGWMKQVMERRANSVRLVVMSATLDVSRIRAFFPHAPLLRVSGRMYAVEVFYAPRPVHDVVEAAVACVLQIHARYAAMTGDVLCFLTGAEDIERAVAATKLALAHTERRGGAGGGAAATRIVHPERDRKELTTDCKSHGDANGTNDDGNRCDGGTPDGRSVSVEEGHEEDGRCRMVRQAWVLPLYGALALSEQQRVFAPCPRDTRKIIFATNIAETSVTIDGVVFVVDGGYQKHKLYSSTQRVDYVLPTVISQASAEQRRGRAGRTRAGQCYRLYTADDFARVFPAQNFAEILRSNMANTLLLLLKLGVDNPCAFPFVEPPAESSLEEAFYQLLYFGAVDEALRLTSFGRQLAELPVDVCLARMLLCASRHGCAGEAVVLAAMLEAGGGAVFVRPAMKTLEADGARGRFQHPDGDHLTLIRVFHAYLRSGTARHAGAMSHTAKAHNVEESNRATVPTAAVSHMEQDTGRRNSPRESAAGGGSSMGVGAGSWSSTRAQALFCHENFLRLQTLQQAEQIYTQLRRWATAAGVTVVSTYRPEIDDMNSAAVRRAILEGFFMQVAFHSPSLHKPSAEETAPYRTVRDGVRAGVHRSSTFWQPARSRRGEGGRAPSWPTWLVYDRLEVNQIGASARPTGCAPTQGQWASRSPSDAGSDGDNVALVRIASAVEVGWLLEQSEFYRNPTEIADGEIALCLTRAREAQGGVAPACE